ncbi:MAG TPA: TonB-dependent receptor plug domain-containing protein [Longimicrobiaceae bacterium]
MSLSRSTTNRVLCALAVAVLTGCHHRSGPTSEYVGSTRLDDGAEPVGVSRVIDRPTAVEAERAAERIRSVAPTSRIEDLFSGRYAGLNVYRTATGGIEMRLRGVEPLLVIDGLEADPVALLTIRPESLVRIEVLRNISDTALYGSRGVNGVVRVTTRR